MGCVDGLWFQLLFVCFALVRLLFLLAQSAHRDYYVLKGGVLVTQWHDHDNRETRDADVVGFGYADVETIKAVFAQIMAITSEDGLDFDTGALTASTIREEMEYGGIRLKTNAYLERTRLPVTLAIAFDDALTHASPPLAYP